ncbi:MAG: PspC domain-containing protein [Solirubrobacteraceae bacterium]|nr:PspC domain-containing protein [Solirubrobacteraceae bacterium]
MDDQTDPTAQQPTPPPPEPEAASRPPLRRTADDRVIGGVCGGVARTLGLDALVVRVVAVVLVLAGGAGALLYVGGLLLMPDDAVPGEPADDRARGRLATVSGVVVLVLAGLVLLSGVGFWLFGPLIPLAFLALLGLGAWWVVSGEGTTGRPADIARRSVFGVLVLVGCTILAGLSFYAGATEGGWIIAAVVIAAGVALLAGAVFRPVRFLILPALALALPLAAAEASDLDLTGGLGERTYRPATAADIRDTYELGAGRLVVDLRGVDLPDGDTAVNLRVGAGQALLLVDRDVCVASRAEVGVGAVQVFDAENGGVAVDWEDLPAGPAGTPRVLVDGEAGIGVVTVDHIDREHDWDDDRDRRWGGRDGDITPTQPACREDRAAD